MPLFEQLLPNGDKVEGDGEKDVDVLAHLLRHEPVNEKHDAILSAAQASRPASAQSSD